MQNQKVKSKFSVEEIQEWLDSPITKYYFQFLEDQAEQRQLLAAAGTYLRDTDYETGSAYRTAMLQAEVYHQCAKPDVTEIHDWEVDA